MQPLLEPRHREEVATNSVVDEHRLAEGARALDLIKATVRLRVQVLARRVLREELGAAGLDHEARFVKLVGALDRAVAAAEVRRNDGLLAGLVNGAAGKCVDVGWILRTGVLHMEMAAIVDGNVSAAG